MTATGPAGRLLTISRGARAAATAAVVALVAVGCGGLGGFRWGLDVKRALLDAERADASTS